MPCELNPAQLIRGPVFLEIDSVDFGLLEAEGIEWMIEDEEVEFKSAQSPHVVARGRSGITCGFKAALAQLTLDRLAILMDTDAAPVGDTLTGTFSGKEKTQRLVVMQCAGPEGKTRFLTATATIMVEGGKYGLNEYTTHPFEAKFLGDPCTGDLFTIQDIAGSAAAPVVSSYGTTIKVDPFTETPFLDGDTGLPVDEWVQITFDKPMNPLFFTGDAYSLTAEDANVDVALTAVDPGVTAGVTDYAKVVLKPAADLAALTKYNLRVSGAVKAIDGFKIAAPVVAQFTTA